MVLSELRDKASTLPQSPGVYIMRDESGGVIYVGKAKKLQNRVKQYFTRLSSHTPKTLKMVSKVSDFDVINAPTELDALLLENNLIKKYKPKYNILLKDDKGYPFIKLADGPYPGFSVESRRSGKGRFFGPFGGRGTANQAVRAVNEIFMLPTCGKTFPRDIGKDRPCLRYHLHKCCGVCTGDVSKEEFAETVGRAVRLFEGKTAELEKQLGSDMEKASEALDFERAALLRDRLRAVRSLKQDNIVYASSADTDAVGFAVKGTRGCVAALSYKDGNLIGKRIIFYDGADEQDAARDVESFVDQYYNMIGTAPRELCLPCGTESPEATESMLSSLRGKKCAVTVPKRGEKLKMVRLAEENARSELELAEKREERSLKALSELAQMLGIKEPERIEAYDISNTAGCDAVASMTVFRDGRPSKRDYKYFKIKLAVPGDDCAAMAETLGRRLDRALEKDESFLPMPDLILADGGTYQVLAVRSQLEKRGLSIPVFGMLKDEKHRTKELVAADGSATGLCKAPAVFSLIGRIQEETHRFAISRHRELHGKRALSSELTKIPGVGEKRGRALLKKFGSVKNIKNADINELRAVLPKNAAEAVRKYFGENNDESDNG